MDSLGGWSMEGSENSWNIKVGSPISCHVINTPLPLPQLSFHSFHSVFQLFSRKSQAMEAAQMQQRLLNFTSSLFQEGFLDEQFTQLQQLQDESNPDFVGEVVSLFFEDSEKLLADLTKTLNREPVDFKKVDASVHQFKGSSSSIGARRVKNICIAFRACCQDQNREGCLQCLHQMKQECYLVKNKLDVLFQLEKQILAAGGTLPVTG